MSNQSDSKYLSQIDIDSVLSLGVPDFYETETIVEDLQAIASKCRIAYKEAHENFKEASKNKTILIEDILNIINNKDNHKDAFWLEQTLHLDLVYLQELDPVGLKEIHDDLMMIENQKKKVKQLISSCNDLQKVILSAAKNNTELRKALHLIDLARDYDASISTSIMIPDLNERKLALSQCLSECTEDNKILGKQIEDQTSILIKNIEKTYKANLLLAEKLNLYLDFSFDEHRAYRDVYTPKPSHSLEVLEGQYEKITKEYELFQRDIEHYSQLYSELDIRKEMESTFAIDEQKKVSKIIGKNKLNTFGKPSSQLLQLLKQDTYSGTKEYDQGHLADIKTGNLDSLDHFMNKSPHNVGDLQPAAKSQTVSYVKNVEKKYHRNGNIDLLFIPLGGGNEIGGSCHLIIYRNTIRTYFYLIDIGIRNLKSGFELPDFKMLSSFGISGLDDLDGIFITHAHADHLGGLFDLIIRPEIKVPIYMSHATKDIFQAITLDSFKFMDPKNFADISLAKWQQIIRSDHALFSGNIVTVEPNQQLNILPGELVLAPYHAGHVIGALGYLFKFVRLEKSVLFTGDFTLRSLKSVRGADYLKIKDVDTIVCEGTNLSRLNVRKMDSYKTFADKVYSTICGGGRVVIPSFSIGKAQEIISLLLNYQISTKKKFTIKIDGLASGITEIYSRYSSTLEGFTFSREENADVIISSAGSMNPDTKIGHHVKSILSDKKSLLIKGSFFDEEYSGWASNYQLDSIKDIHYGGEHFSLNCEIYDFKIPLHAELYEIEQLINQLKPTQVQFVHTLSTEEHNIAPSFSGSIKVGWPKNFELIPIGDPS